MQARLTILCENSVAMPFGVVGEHGFACYVETESGDYLFDTGQGLGIVRNALALNKDLRSVRSILISHGHYDHTGGLPAVLTLRGSVDVFGHPEMFNRRVWSDARTSRDIGIPYRRGYLESLGARFRLEKSWTQVGPGLYLTGEIPRRSPFEKGDMHMTQIAESGKPVHPDPLNDDLSMVVDTAKGLILVLGCAHAGMINIIRHVQQQLGRKRIYAVIGGTHLGFSSDEQFDATLEVVNELDIERIGVSHCTGLIKASLLHARLGDRFFFGSVGTVLEG